MIVTNRSTSYATVATVTSFNIFKFLNLRWLEDVETEQVEMLSTTLIQKESQESV